MTRYMLDTDICSYLIRGGNEHLNAAILSHREGLCISAITLAELLYGAAKRGSPRLTAAVAAFQQLVEIRAWTPSAAIQHAAIRADLESAGSPIGNMDMLIAAAARSDGAIRVGAAGP
jgi:tRNA(fMet)-specific endonuclease VapC